MVRGQRADLRHASGGWHLAKIVLHAVVVILCFRVAQLLTGEIATALLTAAIFAVMPAHVEAVVWASSIPEPLSTAFELGALLCPIGAQAGLVARIDRRVDSVCVRNADA